MENQKQEFIGLLKSIDRKGIDDLILWVNTCGFFDGPASTKYHGSYKGGLLYHSLSVYNIFSKQVQKLNLSISEESIIICSLLHDLCKINAYVETPQGYIWNKKHVNGHSVLSLRFITRFINLTDLETEIIKYHMGYYGSYEFSDEERGEYSLSQLTAAQNFHNVIKLFHFCDDYSTQWLED